jgi:2-C-methyl-D-erythritol 4-phosphate cytidylyltransferase
LSTDDFSVWAIVPAAGSGSRMRTSVPKQYLPLLGKPVIQHTLERLSAHSRVRGVLVGLAPDDAHWKGVATNAARPVETFQGGATRAHTVLNGLAALAACGHVGDWVMVHDAVRPCLRPGDIDRLIEAATKNDDGGLLALPVSDTVKRVDERGRVQETVSRTNLWRAMTPQLFRVGRLHDALNQALVHGLDITDEACAIESAGGKPVMVPCHADNIKITVPEELTLAELFLRQQGAG